MLEASNLHIKPITLVFTTILLFSFGVLIQNAFGDGVQPGSCNNEYDGQITNATIIAENKAYYPLNNNVSFQLPFYKSYYLTFTVKTPSINDQGNSLPGNVWIDQDYQGFANSGCYGTAYPNQNFTVNETISHATSTSVFWATEVSGFSYTVNWLYTPSAPQNLQASAGNSQVTLSWTVVNGGRSPITNYNIYRSASSGTETLLSTTGNVTSYTDTGLANGQTYFYKITAVSSVGESSQSNEASATVPSASSVDNVIATILFGNQLPFGVGVNPTTNKIYVSSPDGAFTSSCCQPNNKVFVIGGSTDNILSNVTVGYESLYVGVNPTTNKIYMPGLDGSCISCNPSSSVYVINGATDTVVNKISAFGRLVGVGVNPTTNKIYIGDSKGHNVYEIDGTTDTVVNTIPVGGEPRGIAVNPTTNKIYVVLSTINEIAIIDDSANAVTGTIPVGDVPTNVAINPITNKIYVANYGSSSCSDVYCPDPSSIGHTVSVIDGSTNDITNTIQVGSGPYDVVTNPSTNKVYVTNHFDSTVSVIDGNTNTVVNTVSVGSRPEGIGTNPITDKTYVANHSRCCPPNPISVSVIEGSPIPSPILETRNMVNIINNMTLTHGITKSLDAKLDATISYLNTNDTYHAKSALQSFVNEVNAQTGKHITQDQANQLVVTARNIIKAIT